MEFLSDIASITNSTLRISTPLVFAAMAGIFAERSGVIDFSLEGKMLMAAFVAAVGSYFFGNPWVGLLMAIVACVSLSMLHGFASVTHKGDQVVSCVAINILPSKLKSITPDRSANIPAIAAKTNGVEILSVEFVIEAKSDKNSIML